MVKVSFFILFTLIISFYITPSALSQEIEKPSEVKQAEPEKPEPPETKPPETKPEEIKKPEIEPQRPEVSGAEPVKPEEEKVVPRRAPKPYAAQGTVSFFFDDADMFEVAQTVFGDVLRVNYIIDPRVKGRVNFRTVSPIPREEVLSVMEVILRLNGVGFVEEKGLYRILPLQDVSKELVYSQVGKEPEKVAIELFTFKNLNLKDSMADIENALGLHLQGGTARILPIYRLNALIVVASSKEQLEYIRKWIEVFDNMFSVARPKIYVYPLQNSKASHIASLLQSIFSGSGSVSTSTPATKTETVKTTTTTTTAKIGAAAVAAGTGFLVSPETKVFADEITNSLIILATPSDYDFIEETIKKIDIMPRQVVIEGLIARVDLTDNLSFGIRWAIKNVNLKMWGINGGTIDINPGLGVNEEGSIVTPSKGFTYIGTSGDELRAMITALAEKSKAKVLAAPHILVSDNREARIQVGSQVPIATSTTTTLTSTTTTTETTSVPVTSTIQYKDIGIILKVKPQVNDSGLVSLEITQEISSLGDTITVGGQAEISINKTEANTNLVAQNGETIVIGGLIQENVSKSKDGIPFLSDIPIIGNLFGNTTDKTTRTELIILLTPHVIRNIEEAGKVTTDYVDKYKGATKDKDINKFIKEKSQKEKSGKDAGSKDSR
ncbi:MAG: secretin N-terminal domain-containing protein [Nitrospirota bacterium]